MYFAPYIDSTGLHIPTYIDIRDKLVDDMKVIFGTDIYIEEDSQDYQQISSFAKMIFDSYNLAQLVYNNRTPITSIGIGLDNLIAFADISRKGATRSNANLVITGDPSTVITNGQAVDVNGIYWDLPPTVTIPDGGSIIVVATCYIAGNIGALPNTINRIATPVSGWRSVTNTNAAIAGSNIETDYELRGRYSKAIKTPSRTVFESMLASIEAIANVLRVTGYENDTADANIYGHPAHSVTFVVEGGIDVEVGESIRLKKTPGCYTNGTTSVDIVTETGAISTIRFYRPTYVPLKIKVTLAKLSSWSSEYSNSIKAAIVDYISDMKIGDKVYRSVIWSVAMSIMSTMLSPAYSVTNIEFSIDGGSTWVTTDAVMDFYEVAQTALADVTVIET